MAVPDLSKRAFLPNLALNSQFPPILVKVPQEPAGLILIAHHAPK